MGARRHDAGSERRGEVADLVTLSRALGEPGRDLVILAEGNASFRLGPDSFAVKVSGSRMASLAAEEVVIMALRAPAGRHQ